MVSVTSTLSKSTDDSAYCKVLILSKLTVCQQFLYSLEGPNRHVKEFVLPYILCLLGTVHFLRSEDLL